METIATAGSLSPWCPGVFGPIVYGAAVMILVAILLFVSSWLGEPGDAMPTPSVPARLNLLAGALIALAQAAARVHG